MLALVADPAAPERLALREAAEPAPGPGTPVVAVEAVALNRGEVNRLATAVDGWRPGWDLAGTIAVAASDGRGPDVGARVVGLLPEGMGWAERAAVPATHLAVLPDTLETVQAAALPVAGLTALRTLRIGGLLLDRRVLITGAAGGVGRFAIQLARRSGADVTAVVGRPERGAGLRELGADRVVLGIEAAEGPFDLVLDAAGGSSLAAALALVGTGGTVVTYGNSAREPSTFVVNDFYTTWGVSLRGFFLLADAGREPPAVDLGHLAQLVADRRLDPQVALVTDWRDADRALRSLRERRVPGKAILRVG
ncbi:MAG TPA: zinc-binding dehydrogenase [Candidatus Micrarchaeia archaeon]|nr:zinc-binding dehydrogenase [Candidatus Micrarchaeia archaeon]